MTEEHLTYVLEAAVQFMQITGPTDGSLKLHLGFLLLFILRPFLSLFKLDHCHVYHTLDTKSLP